MTRTGAEYLESLRDGRHIVIDGERVDDVTTHPAFARSVRSFARLYDIAGEQPDVMTFPSPTDGRPVNKAWFDDIQVYLSSSTDGGATWSPARVISSGSSSSAYPTVAAPAAGRVDVAWFGADRPGNANDRSVMGPAGATSSAAWKVWLARSTDGGRSFRRAVISDTVHFGELCTHGGGCENPGRTRTLFDDFGLGATRDGRSVVAFTTDQPGGTLESDRIAWLTERPGTK